MTALHLAAEEAAEAGPALAHPVHQQLLGRHQLPHRRAVAAVLVPPQRGAPHTELQVAFA